MSFGHRRDADSTGGLLLAAWRLFGARAAVLLPMFVGSFVVLRLVLRAFLASDVSAGSAVLSTFLLQIFLPAIVGTFLIAEAAAVFAGAGADNESRRDLRPLDSWFDLGRAGLVSSAMALVVTVVLPLGVFLVPAVFGPPIVVQEIVLARHTTGVAFTRAGQLVKRDARVPLMLVLVSLATGLAVASLLGALADSVLGVGGGGGSTGAFYLLGGLQGALNGIALAYIAALSYVGHAELLRRAGGGPSEAARE
jgi:hypothetical protein